MKQVLLVVAAYIIGSIPTALWMGKMFFGIDIREHGSRNMGASNSFRIMGPLYGIIVLVIDMGKGMLAVLLANAISPTDLLGGEKQFWQLLFGLTGVIGHIFPVFAGFRGGKGVATLFGAVLLIQPFIALASIASFALVIFLTSYISLASIVGVIVFAACIFFAVKENNVFMKWFSAAAALLVIIMHRSNITRLLYGKENKLNWKRKNNNKPES